MEGCADPSTIFKKKLFFYKKIFTKKNFKKFQKKNKNFYIGNITPTKKYLTDWLKYSSIKYSNKYS